MNTTQARQILDLMRAIHPHVRVEATALVIAFNVVVSPKDGEKLLSLAELLYPKESRMAV